LLLESAHDTTIEVPPRLSKPTFQVIWTLDPKLTDTYHTFEQYEPSPLT
jgi:hypothetical protein